VRVSWRFVRPLIGPQLWRGGGHLALSGYLRGLLPRQLAGASFAAIFVAMRVAGGLVLAESGHFLSDVRS
jgi:hypothetical protein